MILTVLLPIQKRQEDAAVRAPSHSRVGGPPGPEAWAAAAAAAGPHRGDVEGGVGWREETQV